MWAKLWRPACAAFAAAGWAWLALAAQAWDLAPTPIAPTQAKPSGPASVTPGAKASAPKGPTYFLVPIRGEYGNEVRAEALKLALDAAKAAKPDVVVVEIDSGGGEVRQMLAVCELLSDWQSKEAVPLAALVHKQAFSAAAISALSVRRLYMRQGSSIGAALIISVGPGGTQSLDSTRVGEKFSSAIRARCRAFAEVAGHSPLIVDAMMLPETELSWARDAAGRPVVLQGTPATQRGSFTHGPVLLDSATKLLSLTASEAHDVGLSQGTVKDLAELGERLGKPGWTAASDRGVQIMDEAAQRVRANHKEYDKAVQLIKLSMTKFNQAAGAQITTMERSIVSTRTLLLRIQKLSNDNDYIAARASGDFPEGFDAYIGVCDRVLGEIKNHKRQIRR